MLGFQKNEKYSTVDEEREGEATALWRWRVWFIFKVSSSVQVLYEDSKGGLTNMCSNWKETIPFSERSWKHGGFQEYSCIVAGMWATCWSETKIVSSMVTETACEKTLNAFETTPWRKPLLHHVEKVRQLFSKKCCVVWIHGWNGWMVGMRGSLLGFLLGSLLGFLLGSLLGFL